VGLLCLRPAQTGGESTFASSVTVYNILVRERPVVAALFSHPLHIDRKGEVPAGKLPTFLIPRVQPPRRQPQHLLPD